MTPEAAICKRILRGYQMQWLATCMRYPFVFILGSRQIGKSMFTALLVAIMLCSDRSRHEKSPRIWTCFSATKPHAVKLAREIKQFVMLIQQMRAQAGIRVPMFEVENSEEIILSNGNSVQVRAATVRSAVGCRGSVLFDEIGVVPEQAAMFEAVYPIVQAALANGNVSKFIVMSNATPKGTWWHHAFSGTKQKEFQRITATWTGCMRAWGKTEAWIAAQRDKIVDAIGVPAYRQWYECEWRSVGGSYFSPDVLDRAGHMGMPFARHQDGVTSIGYDVGRHMDPAAITSIHQRIEGQREVRYATHGTLLYDLEYQAQRDYIRGIVEGGPHGVARIVVDRTGSGDQQAEDLEAEFGGVVEPFLFSEASKWMLMSKLRDDFSSGILRIDRGDLDTRMHLESVTTKVNKSGKVAIDTPRQGTHHCDLAISLGLANYGFAAR